MTGKLQANSPDKIEAEQQIPKNKKHHLWPWVVGGILIIILIPILVVGFFGFMPGVSSLLGTNKPKNLGVTYTAADYASYQQKTGAQFLDNANAPQSSSSPTSKRSSPIPNKWM